MPLSAIKEQHDDVKEWGMVYLHLARNLPNLWDPQQNSELFYTADAAAPALVFTLKTPSGGTTRLITNCLHKLKKRLSCTVSNGLRTIKNWYRTLVLGKRKLLPEAAPAERDTALYTFCVNTLKGKLHIWVNIYPKKHMGLRHKCKQVSENGE